MSVTINYLNGSNMEELELDATPTQTHAGENEITEHPVETGTDIVDHVRVKPDKLTLEGLITDTPMAGNPSQAPLSAEAYQQLQQFKSGGQLLTVTTTLRTYDNMVITSLSVPREAKTGGALRFTVAFEQIKVVGTQTVAIAITPRSQSKLNLGSKTPQPAADQDANVSYLGLITGVHAAPPS